MPDAALAARRPGRRPRRSPLTELGRARVSVAVCFFVFGALLSTWVSRIPAIQHNLHLDSAALGLSELGLPVGQVVAMQVVSGLVRRWTSAAAARGAVVATGVSVILVGLARSPIELAAFLGLLGVALGALDTCMNTQAVAAERRVARPTMSAFHGVYSVGVLVGALLGSVAAGLRIPPWEHFSCAAALFAALAGLGMRWLLGPDADRLDDEPPGARAAPPARLRAHPLLIAIGLIAFCSLFAEGAVENWSGVFLHQVRHASYRLAPLGVAACGIGMAAGRFAGDGLIARWGRTRVLACTSLVAVAGMALALVGGSVGASLAGYALFGLGIATIVPIAFTVAGNTPRVAPAWAISRASTMGYAGQLASPAIIGLVAHRVGLTAALVIPAVLLCLIVPVALVVRPR